MPDSSTHIGSRYLNGRSVSVEYDRVNGCYTIALIQANSTYGLGREVMARRVTRDRSIIDRVGDAWIIERMSAEDSLRVAP